MNSVFNEDVDALFDAILTLKNREECYAFFEDALTSREILDIAQRLKAAKMLRSGMCYLDVCKENHMSSATLSRVSKALEGGRGGYDMVMNRVNEK